MLDRVATLWPEITLLITVLLLMITGTSGDKDFRRVGSWIAGLGLFIAFVLAARMSEPDTLLPRLAGFMRPAACVVGVLLLLGLGNVDARFEKDIDAGRRFDPLEATHGEFLCFFLLSLAGLMLCTTASDLIWLFLALEMTSLPTYIMVATGRSKVAAREAAVKYFFLGAAAAAVFLYGFAMLYGATGSLHLIDIRAALEAQAAAGGISPLAILGLTLSIIGISFKIAAVPMHFYTADVYEGAATPVTAFLAFVPKAAGFVTLMLLLSTALHLGEGGQPWPEAIRVLLWVLAALTMTIGNALAMWQNRIKRVLAYSSIAHSGYMLVGLVAAMETAGSAADSPTTNGFAAVLFYLVAYGLTNLGAFYVLACLQRRGEELETFDDLEGLWDRHGGYATIMALCALSLMGLPPLIGFFAKLFLFTSAIRAGEYTLVVIAGLNSAAAAWYYLRLAGVGWVHRPGSAAAEVERTPAPGRRFAAGLSAVAAVALVILTARLITAGDAAVQLRSPAAAVDHAAAPAAAESASRH
ncbi:MAG: NADH-quinone oxidoreductase subunit N [Phycisphaerales bacterium]|nr:NADH-quinone oxidoreductase subunit N [Phycisphaerales bacterium]